MAWFVVTITLSRGPAMVRIAFAVRVAFFTSLLLSTESQAQEASQPPQAQPPQAQTQPQAAESTQQPQTLPPVTVKNAPANTARKRSLPKKIKVEAPVKHGPAQAAPENASAAPSDASVVYSANLVPTEASRVGSTVNVLTQKDIEAQSRPFLQSYLDTLPGVNVSQNGPAGSVSTVNIRGVSNPYIKVLVDGIDISDPAATQTAPAFEHLLVGDVQRVELLKGSQSTLYGGDAVGGVITVDTQKAGLGLTESGSFEYGAYNTARAVGTAGYGAKDGDILFTIQGLSSGGFPSADEKNGNTQDDPYQNLTVSGRGEYKPSDDLRVFFAMRALDSDVRYADGMNYVTGLVADGSPNAAELTHLYAGRVGFEHTSFNGAFDNTFAVQGLTDDRKDYGYYPAYYDADRVKGEYLGVIRLNSWFKIIEGADYEQDGAQTNAEPGVRHSVDLSGAFAQIMAEPVKGLALTGGGRIDENSAFGDFPTYRLTGAYQVGDTGTILRSSLGTGFRAPSLYELYAPYSFGTPVGNPNLQPETSQSFDAGIEQPFFGGRFRLTATYFQLDTDNQIQFIYQEGYVQVPGVTHRDGVELSAKAAIAPLGDLYLAYTYIDARYPSGIPVIHVPRAALSIGLDTVLFDTVKLNVTGKFVDGLTDYNFTLNQYVDLNDYFLVGAKLSYDIKPGVTAYIRGENILNETYETVLGYGTPKFSAFAGLAFKFGS